MDRQPGDRIFGVETEFGCLVSDESLGSPEVAVETIKNYLFYDLRLGAIDLHSRDEVFEPAESGGFLMNGARLYIDAVGSHLEYATAECRQLDDLIANDRAGQRQIVRAIHEMGLEDGVSIYNNSVDHFGGHTFGCHENYLIRAEDDFLQRAAPQFYPFLVTRQIFAGVGRVGGHILSGREGGPTYQDIEDHPIDYIWVSQIYGVLPDTSVPFQLSQRADHILKTMASKVRFNRAIINPKWEHYYTHDGMTRLHLLFGESNQNEYAYKLKIGTTLLVLRLLEDGLVPEWLDLASPIRTLRTVSRDQTFKWPVMMANGDQMSAIAIQREYLQLAQLYGGESTQTDWILREWESILDGLEKDPMQLGDRIDWVAKRQIVEEYKSEENLSWTDDALHSVDLEYHNIDPSTGLFYGYQEMGRSRRELTDLDITVAMTDPPQDTRAKARARLVEQVLNRRGPQFYMFDWSGVALDRYNYVDLTDPFETYEGVDFTSA